jgi:DNA replication and repair protein RecF
MNLKKIQLQNFRNYENQYYEFSEGINCIVGKNGSGKTNLLDAIYFLSVCKSSLHNQDSLSIKFGEDYSIVEGLFGEEFIKFSLQKAGKKVFFTDQKPYDKFSDHIGKFPVVLIAPDDTDLIRDGSETRRRLFDGILSQFDTEYLKNYILYNKNLDQRNSLLKQFAENQYFEPDLLDIYTQNLITTGQLIHSKRKTFIEDFFPVFQEKYQFLSENNETVSLSYESDWSKDESPYFGKYLQQDIQAQRTTHGIHKDDFLFEMEEKPLKKFGSQGQRKSFILAIRLAQFELMSRQTLKKPILLLDDIFDKLDDKRIAKLIELISQGQFGQVFITDARPQRTRELLKQEVVNYIETTV